jgi:hypothetical protein
MPAQGSAKATESADQKLGSHDSRVPARRTMPKFVAWLQSWKLTLVGELLHILERRTHN